MSDGRLPFRFSNSGGTAISPIVLLGDRDIAANVSRVEFESGVGGVPRVVLTMPLIKGATLDLAGAIVEVSQDNREILIDLGWTPPAGGPSVEQDDPRLVEMLRKHIRLQGGDAQKALGS